MPGLYVEIIQSKLIMVFFGRWAGHRSIAALAEAIADGEVICVSKAAVKAAAEK